MLVLNELPTPEVLNLLKASRKVAQPLNNLFNLVQYNMIFYAYQEKIKGRIINILHFHNKTHKFMYYSINIFKSLHIKGSGL